MNERDTASLEVGLVKPSAEILNRRASEVDVSRILSPEVQGLIDAMFGIAYGEQGDSERPTMVGLAAPQVGITMRIILVGANSVGNGEQPELKAYINPVIELSKEIEEGREGCYSTGKVCGVVPRSKSIRITALDRDGNEVVEELEGFPARILQHEVDHLEGIRFPDRITDDSKLHWVESEEFGDYRKHWHKWNVVCSRAKWQAIKNGTDQ